MLYVTRAAVARKESLASLRAKPELRKATEQMLWAYAAASACLEGSGSSEMLGLVLGSGQGEIETTKEYFKFLGRDGMARPFLFQNSLHHSTAGMLSQTLGIKGPSATVSDHFFSGESALDLAQTFLDSAQCSACLVVGVDTLVPELEVGVRARYPEGLVVGEGAGALLVAREATAPLFRILSSRVLRAPGAENAALPGFYDSNAIAELAAANREGIFALPKPDGTSSRFELGVGA